MDLTKDLIGYASKFLYIDNKEGGVSRFIFNDAQMYLHNRLEEQKEKQGYVRAIIIKGRQQGCTTYITARYYHSIIFNKGVKAFILSHEAKTTATIFDKVKKYQSSVEKIFKNFAPKVIASNNNKLVFDRNIGGEYTIGTAGNKDVGRGTTNQKLHLSEAAFYDSPEDIEKGLVQSVGEGAEGTEIIYETTANGQNYLYNKIKLVKANPLSEYQVIFIPWFWQKEYCVPEDRIPDNFEMTEEELILVKVYKLIPGQILWRRRKIEAFKGDVSSFKQEYPCSLEEAFEYTGSSLVRASDVLAARATTLESPFAPIIMGVDGAGSGDRTVFVIRQGRKILKHEIFFDMKQDRLFGLIAERIQKHGIDMTFVDPAYGQGAVDFLHQSGYKNKVVTVPFQSGAIRSDLYINKRSEIMHAVADWFVEGADIPDDDEFSADILSIPEAKKTSLHKRQIVSKEEIKKVLKRSTDIMDALALTFSFPVKKDSAALRKLQENARGTIDRVSKIETLNVKRGINNRGHKTKRQNNLYQRKIH